MVALCFGYSFCLVVLVALISTGRGAVSPSVLGDWKISTDPGRECAHLHLCTPNNRTFYLKDRSVPFFDHVSACAMLEREGISKIFFVGDSYMRQIFQSFVITLTGDYKEGSVPLHFRGKKHRTHCTYQTQFTHRNCSDEEGGFPPREACFNNTGGPVKLVQYKEYYYSMENLDHCKNEKNSTVTLWSEGNHPVGKPRQSVNNYESYQAKYLANICPNNKRDRPARAGAGPYGAFGPHNPCSLWWVSTHYRLHAYWPQEVPMRVQEYNEYMRMFMENGTQCGDVHYIDLYNMTQKLATNEKLQPRAMSYDEVHWNMEVNLLKAQLILTAFDHSGSKLASPPNDSSLD